MKTFEIVTLIRNELGSIQGLSEIQVYMSLELVLMNLIVSLRPKDSSWPIILLEVFMLNSINWYQFHVISKRFEHVKGAMKTMESYLIKEWHWVESLDDEIEYDESHNEDVDPICYDDITYEEESESCIPHS